MKTRRDALWKYKYILWMSMMKRWSLKMQKCVRSIWRSSNTPWWTTQPFGRCRKLIFHLLIDTRSFLCIELILLTLYVLGRCDFLCLSSAHTKNSVTVSMRCRAAFYKPYWGEWFIKLIQFLSVSCPIVFGHLRT